MSPAEVARAWLLARWESIAHGGHPLHHDPPPNAAALWAQHQKAAGRIGTLWPIARYPRLAYGLVHTTAATAIYWLLWATFSPIGLIVTVAVTWACGHYLFGAPL